jgi:hypothetical protein
MERENLEQIALAIEAAGNTALVPKFAVGDEVLEVVMSYQIETEFSRTPVYESELSPRCSHTHTTCDECHERIER